MNDREIENLERQRIWAQDDSDLWIKLAKREAEVGFARLTPYQQALYISHFCTEKREDEDHE